MSSERVEQIRALVRDEFNFRQGQREADLYHSVGWPVYTEDEILAALDSLLELRLSQGPRVKQFEQNYAAYLGLPSGAGALGFKPQISLSRGIEKTLNWYREHYDQLVEVDNPNF